MWVLRAFRDAVVAAVLTVFRGWMALLWRPWESTLLIATLPLNLSRTWGLFGELFGPGVMVKTPRGERPTLRTVIAGFGDLTTSAVESPALTPALVADHFAAVREQLEPLAAMPEALLRANALGMVAMTAYLNRDTFSAERWPDMAFDLLESAFVISFIWAFVVRLAARLFFRAGRWWLDREPRA